MVLVLENPDRALVKRCLRGNRTALAEVVEKYQRPLFNAAYRILGNREDAADVTQAAFLKAFEHLGNYDPKYKFFSWIYRIAVNESINQIKRNKKHEPLAENEATPDSSPYSSVEDDDLKHWIQDGLMALGEDYRAVVVLRHFSDLSYREISDVLGIPEKTVKWRLYTARQSMKERLTANGIQL
jgi:RNA polymerase sigma-70 factor (ECF subfamily)